MSAEAPQVAEALRMAGIPKRYHQKDRGLRSLGLTVADQLAGWVETDAKAEITAGKGRFFVGSSIRALDLFYSTARSLTVHRMSVWALSIPVMGKLLWTDEFRDKVDDIDVLCVHGFYDAHFKNPLPEEMLSSLDWFFRRRLLNEQSILFQATHIVSACEWWSPTLLALVSNAVGTPIMADQEDIRSRSKPPVTQPKRVGSI